MVTHDSGVDGNARLTAATGAVLTVLLFVEGVTLLRIHQLISVHFFVGLLLVPPVLLKIGTTFYRFVRYYTRSETYVAKGPPNVILRVTGPLVVVSTLALFGTGIALIWASRGSAVVGWHKASFVIWFILMALHFLGHLPETAQLVWRDWVARDGRRRGRRLRVAMVALTLVAGVGAGIASLPAASHWHGGGDNFGEDG